MKTFPTNACTVGTEMFMYEGEIKSVRERKREKGRRKETERSFCHVCMYVCVQSTFLQYLRRSGLFKCISRFEKIKIVELLGGSNLYTHTHVNSYACQKHHTVFHLCSARTKHLEAIAEYFSRLKIYFMANRL